MPILFFHLHLHFSNSCVCVSEHVYAFPSSPIFIHIYRHIHMYGLYSVLYLSSFYLISSFNFFFNRHLCHGAYWCTHNLAHILILRFLLYLHFGNSCVCVRHLVYALHSCSLFIHIYRHIYLYICWDYSVMAPYKLYTSIIISLGVPAPTGWSRAHVWMSTPCAAILLE